MQVSQVVKSTTGTRHRYWISLSGYAQTTRVNHDIRLLVLAVFDEISLAVCT